MTNANLTAEQNSRIEGMNAADAANWTAYYTEQNATKNEAVVEARILEAIEDGTTEPRNIRVITGVNSQVFNQAIRMLKLMGSIQIDEAGLLFA